MTGEKLGSAARRRLKLQRKKEKGFKYRLIYMLII
jgi:hypothetical protein